MAVDNAATLSEGNSKVYLSCLASLFHGSQDTNVTALYDTAADQNIMASSYFSSAFNITPDQLSSYLEESNLVLVSYSGHKIPVTGEITLLIQLTYKGIYRPLKFMIVPDDTQSITPMIIGMNGIHDLKLSLTYNQSESNHPPFLYTLFHPDRPLDSQYLTDYDLQICKSKTITLEPGQTKFIPMFIEHYYNVTSQTEVIISDDNIPTNQNIGVKLYPTKSVLTANEDGQLYGHVLAKNLTHQIIEQVRPTGYLEHAQTYEIKDFTYDFDPNSMFIHEVTVLQDTDQYLNIQKQPNVGRNKHAGSINQIRLDPDTLPIYAQAQPKSHSINLIEKTFPEAEGYIPNPLAVNNDVPKPNISLSDLRSSIEDILDPADPDTQKEFEDNTDTIQLGLRYIQEDEDLMGIINEPRGYSVPTDNFIKPEDLVVLEDYPPEVRHYIEDIFIKNYPSIISTHTTDRGDMSRYLGNYTIRLKPGQTLPQHKKLYYLSPVEKLQMQSILEFLLKNGTIERANLEGDAYNNYASPAYLIPKADKNACPRLIVNFQQLNPCLQAEPALLPTAEALIHSLRDKYIHSSSDLANAFHSITLEPGCRDLTLFSTPLGSFRHASLPTGIKTSPESLSRFMEKILHYEVVFDENGTPVMEGQVAKMEYSPIPQVQSIYDDFIVSTELASTKAETLDMHYQVLKKVMGRLHTHQGKISLKKSQLFKSRVNFFGVFISHNFVCVDQRRIQKLLDAPMPTTPKLMRGFLGLLNSLRIFLRFDILQPSEVLTPLTSSKMDKTFKPTEEQVQAFQQLKTALATGPIFSKLVNLTAPKVILTDAAGTDRGSFSAVLAQIVKPEHQAKTLPSGYNFEDPLHTILYDKRLPIQPLPLQHKDEDIKTYTKRIQDDQPPEYLYLKDNNLGYEDATVTNSLGTSLQLLLDLNKVQTPLSEILKKASHYIRTSMLRYKYIEFIHNNDKQLFQSFIQDLEAGKIHVDAKQFIFESLSNAMYRPIIVVTNIPGSTPITEHNSSKTKPPFVFLLYQHKDQLIVRPAMFTNRNSFNLTSLSSMFEIVAYVSKRITPTLSSLHIIELELTGILYALSSFAKLVGKHAECVLLTDAKCVYYLFNNNALAASCKLQRWNYKLLETMPQIKISYLRGGDNLADWLSRAYSANLPDIKRVALPRYIKSELDNVLPSYKIWTVEEWKQFVSDNPNYLGYDELPSQPKLTINSLTAENKAIGKVLEPLAILKKRISMATVIEGQKEEYQDIYTQCLQTKTQSCKIKQLEYQISDTILFIKIKEEQRILLPTKLLPVIISYTHLLLTHSGEGKMILNLQNFYHSTLKKLVRAYCKACYGCQVQNSSTKLERFGLYVTIDRPFETVSIDFIQSLPPYRNYNHILTVVCQLTGTLLVYPMKSLTSREFLNTYMFNIHTLYHPKKILCDNATTFLEKQNLIYLASINVQVLYSSAYYSQSKGLVESANKIIKWAIIKILADYQATTWVHVLPLVARLYNTTKNKKTNFTPLELLFGSRSSLAKDHFGVLPVEHYHPLIQNEHKQVEALNQELSEKLQTAKTTIDEERTNRIKELNKTRIHKQLQIDDLILVKNFQITQGVNTNLRPIFHLSPYRVLEISPHSCVCQRISDQMIQKLNLNHVKKFTPLDTTFDNLPPEILQIITKPFTTLTDEEIANIVETDTLPLPTDVNIDNPQPAVIANIPPPTIDNNEDPELPTTHSEDSSSDDDSTNLVLPSGMRLRNTAKRKIRFAASQP